MNRLPDSADIVGNLELLGEGTSFQDRICDMLSKVSLFDDFTPAELQLMASHMHAYVARAGKSIIREGDPGGHLCMVISGKVGVYKEDASGKSRCIATITPGKSFGEMSLLDELPYSAGIVAQTDTELVLISRENFHAMVATCPSLGMRLIWKIARLVSLRLRQTSLQLVDYLE